MRVPEYSTKLAIVCGLPGSCKTTYAKLLERKLGAVRFCPDEWLEALSLNPYGRKQNYKSKGWP